MNIFDSWPNKIVFGKKSAEKLSKEIEYFNVNKLLIFTDKVIEQLPFCKDIFSNLKNHNYKFEVYNDVRQNPSDEDIVHGVAGINAYQPELLIAVGGGSVIDFCKAVNIVYTHGGVIQDYEMSSGGIERIKPILLPVIAIPTTAGTSSEVSLATVITDTQRRWKMAIVSPHIIPDVAILDPYLTVTMPKKITADTGMDALCHCIEAYLSSVNFPPACAQALYGIRLINKNIRNAYFYPEDIEAREKMLIASSMAGLAVAHNILGLVHAMSQQVTTFHGLSHGLANAILLPYVMEFNLPAVEDKMIDLAWALGNNTDILSKRQAAQIAIESVKMIGNDLGIPEKLSDAGVTDQNINYMVENAIKSPEIWTNPREASSIEILKIYKKAF